MSRAFNTLRTRTRQDGGRRRSWAARAAVVAALSLSVAGCTSQQTQGQASSYLIINSLRAANGALPDDLAGTFNSDVLTYVKKQVGGQQVLVPTIFEDPALVSMTLGMKNPNAAPSPTNFITVTRYRVNYVRADGRNTPGVDVPYPFDGGMTMTVTETASGGSFSIVRTQAKLENPLKPLVAGGGAVAISAIAEVTFYGTDQAGREVSVTGKIGVTFSDWGDPD